MIVEQMGLKGQYKCVVAPGIKDNDEGGRKVGKKRASQYKPLWHEAMTWHTTARVVKEFCRGLSELRDGEWTALKRLGGYLIGRTRMTIMFKYQSEVKEKVNLDRYRFCRL